MIAHEIAHSWTGNLVTNKDWQHFWLNEGHTVFVERKIVGRMYGESHRQFAFIGGWTALYESVGRQLSISSFISHYPSVLLSLIYYYFVIFKLDLVCGTVEPDWI